jgi:hypothetical protein
MNICANPNCENPVTELAAKTGLPKKHCSTKCRGKHNSLISRERAKQTCLDRYGVENPQQLKNIKEKTIHTLIEKYGVSNPSNIPGATDKKKATCLKNYGKEHHLQTIEGKAARKNTNKSRYGVENPFQSETVKEKIKQHYISVYGKEYPGQVDEIKQKMKESHLAKRGVENPSQDPKVQSKIMKTGLSTKEYVFPSGRTVLIQGYEKYTLDYLLTLYEESDIIAGDPERIPYVDYEDEFGHQRRYFPDTFVPKDNLIVETKSTYTFLKDREKNLRKKEAAEKLGYKFEFFIYDGNKRVTENEIC